MGRAVVSPDKHWQRVPTVSTEALAAVKATAQD
jgi:hypothetical protein